MTDAIKDLAKSATASRSEDGQCAAQAHGAAAGCAHGHNIIDRV